MAISLTNEKNTVHGKGDVCLNISPFDNFRLFTLYENWKDDDRKPIDLSNAQSIYLIFKSKKKEIRIPSYDDVNAKYNVDKVNGQVLFKISKKNAIDILAMDDNTFYITRVYEITDMTGDHVISSDEEVIYTGKWRDESDNNTAEDYTSKLKRLMGVIEEKNKLINDLQESNSNLMKQNVEFASQIESLTEQNENLNTEITELEQRVTEYETGREFSGEIVDANKGTMIHVSTDKNFTEKEWEDFVKQRLSSEFNV